MMMPAVYQLIQGSSKQRHFVFWIVTLGVRWNAELVFN